MKIVKYFYHTRIEIYEKAEGYDESGFPISEDVLKYTLFADVRTLEGREYTAAALTDIPKAYTRFIIRYSPAVEINNKMWIKLRSDFYDITSVMNDNYRNKTITIAAFRRGEGHVVGNSYQT